MKNPFVEGDIYFKGFVGDAGTRKLAEIYQEKLAERFSKDYLRNVFCITENSLAFPMTQKSAARTHTHAKEKALPADNEMQVPAKPHPGSTEEKMMFLKSAIAILEEKGYLEIPLGDSGLLGGLWELAQKTLCGFLVDLRKAPIHQETIEVSEWLSYNPYEIDSSGASLLIFRKGDIPDEPLEKIGTLKKEKGKWILRGDGKQCLNRPKKKGIVC